MSILSPAMSSGRHHHLSQGGKLNPWSNIIRREISSRKSRKHVCTLHTANVTIFSKGLFESRLPNSAPKSKTQSAHLLFSYLHSLNSLPPEATSLRGTHRMFLSTYAANYVAHPSTLVTRVAQEPLGGKNVGQLFAGVAVSVKHERCHQ